jgi:SAM-dependent methyltransferase
MFDSPRCIRDFAHTGRTEAQLRNHYLVEKALADRLRASTREERLELFPKLYDELFAKVPDHPRLHRRESEEELRRSVAARMAIVRESITPETVFMEIAPGDCALACEVARHVKTVYAADISDQRAPGLEAPPNFHMVVFDGLHLDVEPGSVDVAFSYQFLEHLHPEDLDPHFQVVARALKGGGLYILDTPHAFSGPHDISRYFSRTADAFHMHEWTYREIRDLGRRHGFGRMSVFRFGRRWDTPLALMATLAAEGILSLLPASLRWRLSQRAFMGVTACLHKDR